MSIKMFEEFTSELNEYERDTLTPTILRGLSHHIGSAKAIKSEEIVKSMRGLGFDITGVRLRKIIHVLRKYPIHYEGQDYFIVAGGSGYFLSNDAQEIKDQVDSFRGRIQALREVMEAGERFLNTLIHREMTQKV